METRERFDRRRDGEFFADLLARAEFSEGGAYVGFVEHAPTSCATSIGTWLSWRSTQQRSSAGRTGLRYPIRVGSTFRLASAAMRRAATSKL